MTPEQFALLTPDLPPAKRAAYLPLLVAAMAQFDITTPERRAAFLAQIGHESGGFRYFQELWGPTAAQRRYEGREDLGNVVPGDGERFKGHGLIQLTGRANHRLYGQKLGLDLETEPELAARPSVAFPLAGLFWKDKGLNALADLGTKAAFVTMTRRINGGVNGLEDRLARWRKARAVLGLGA